LNDILAQSQPIVALSFLASAMFSLGLDLTLRQIVDPLRNRRLLGYSLAANVVLVPLLAIVLSRVIPMDEALAIGVVVYGLAAGTEGGPKFTQLAKGNAGFAVGLLAVLLSITVLLMPAVLSLAVPDAHVDRLGLLLKLLVAVALPIGLGLAIRARRPALADRMSVVMHRASLALLAVFFVLVVYVNFAAMLELQVGAMVCALLFFAIAFGMGYAMGGPRRENRRTLAIMTFVRNAPISMATAIQVFPDQPGVLVMVTLLSSLSLVCGVVAVVVLNRLPAPAPAPLETD
jgi:bile acid:Na+ symporter, BASS family